MLFSAPYHHDVVLHPTFNSTTYRSANINLNAEALGVFTSPIPPQETSTRQAKQKQQACNKNPPSHPHSATSPVNEQVKVLSSYLRNDKAFPIPSRVPGASSSKSQTVTLSHPAFRFALTFFPYRSRLVLRSRLINQSFTTFYDVSYSSSMPLILI